MSAKVDAEDGTAKQVSMHHQQNDFPHIFANVRKILYVQNAPKSFVFKSHHIARRRLRVGPGSGCGSSSPTLPSLWAITRLAE